MRGLRWHPLHGWMTDDLGSGELNRLAQQKYGRMYGALTKEEQRSLIPSEPGYDRLLTKEEEAIMSDTQEPKTQKINRLDPAWAQFGCACIQHLTAKHRDAQFTADDWRGIVDASATFADAMLRERDRRDRGECEGPLDQEEWDEMQKARRDEA